MSDENDREVAKKFAKDWRYEGIVSFAHGNLMLGCWAIKEVIVRLERAFLAGIQHARQGQKEMLKRFCESLIENNYIVIVGENQTRECLNMHINQFLEQEAKNGN